MTNTVFLPVIIDFVKVTLEYCSLVEQAKEHDKKYLINRLTSLLPLIYLNISLIPEMDEYHESDLNVKVDEALYTQMMESIADILGEDDLYLETFHPDMQFSDTPVAVKISENIADIYQDLGNFIAVFKNGEQETMNDSLFVCIQNFREYWGQRLVNALRAVHHLKYQDL